MTDYGARWATIKRWLLALKGEREPCEWTEPSEMCYAADKPGPVRDWCEPCQRNQARHLLRRWYSRKLAYAQKRLLATSPATAAVKARTVHEFRVSWTRGPDADGFTSHKSRTFGSMKTAQKRIDLLGPEPWKAFGKQPDDLDCCSGQECGCGGLTVREASDRCRERMPPVGEIKVYRRVVTRTAWEPIQ